MNFSEIKKVISDAAKATGIDEYDVYYSVSSDISAETLKSEISGFSSSESIGIGFRCIVDGKFGQASCEYITKSEPEYSRRGCLNWLPLMDTPISSVFSDTLATA